MAVSSSLSPLLFPFKWVHFPQEFGNPRLLFVSGLAMKKFRHLIDLPHSQGVYRHNFPLELHQLEPGDQELELNCHSPAKPSQAKASQALAKPKPSWAKTL